jgi:hypothetical protein
MPFVFRHMNAIDQRNPQALREWAVEQRNRAAQSTSAGR